MWASGAYTTKNHRIINSTVPLNFMRSAVAPVISAGVMIANINWYTMKVICGIVSA